MIIKFAIVTVAHPAASSQIGLFRLCVIDGRTEVERLVHQDGVFASI
ncbi:MAG: hypothetical protein ISQ09_09255 [Rubripirellula sp.]|nr:hypothetical protein [Rubripirellula sp.]